MPTYSILAHTWKDKTATMLHLLITQVRQFISFGSQISHHTSHRKANLCASPQENFKSAFMRNKLNSLLPSKRTNPFIIPYHWPHHKFHCPFFSGLCDWAAVLNIYLPLKPAAFISDPMFVYAKAHLLLQFFFKKQNQPYP